MRPGAVQFQLPIVSASPGGARVPARDLERRQAGRPHPGRASVLRRRLLSGEAVRVCLRARGSGPIRLGFPSRRRSTVYRRGSRHMVETLDPPDDPDSAPDPVGLARDALALLVAREPERHPLVVALVAPLGAPLGTVEVLLEESFARFGYAVEHVHLSDLLDTIPYKPLGDMPDRQDKQYYQRRMDAGDRLRSDVGHGSALAALAAGEVHDRRREGGAVVFILRSLKHPDEEALLRQVYGDAFSLLAVSSPVSERIDALTQTLRCSTTHDPKRRSSSSETKPIVMQLSTARTSEQCSRTRMCTSR